MACCRMVISDNQIYLFFKANTIYQSNKELKTCVQFVSNFGKSELFIFLISFSLCHCNFDDEKFSLASKARNTFHVIVSGKENISHSIIAETFLTGPFFFVHFLPIPFQQTMGGKQENHYSLVNEKNAYIFQFPFGRTFN